MKSLPKPNCEEIKAAVRHISTALEDLYKDLRSIVDLMEDIKASILIREMKDMDDSDKALLFYYILKQALESPGIEKVVVTLDKEGELQAHID